MSRFSAPFAAVLALPLAAAVWVAAGEGGPEEADQAVEEQRERAAALVERLGSAERAERVAAERELIEWGPGALEILPDESAVDEPSARAGLERVRERLEEMRAERAVEATLVSINSTGTAEHVANAGWLSFTPEQARRPLAFSFDGARWWEVVDEIARQTETWPAGIDALGFLTLRERVPDDASKRVGYDAAFRMAAGPVTVREVAGEEGRGLVRVPLEIRGEPRLRLLFAKCSAADLRLVAADGEELAAFTPRAKYDLPFAGDAAELRLDFVAEKEDVQEPLRLGGRVSVTVAVGEAHFTGHFEPVTTATREIPVVREEHEGGVTVRFRELTRKPDGTAEVEIAVVYDEGGPAFESHRTWVYHNEAHVVYSVDKDERAKTYGLDPEPGFSTVAQADGGVVLRYRFRGIPGDAADVRFTYAAPTRIVEAPVTIDVEGLAGARHDAEAAVSGGSGGGR